jgi:hypothetical protein
MYSSTPVLGSKPVLQQPRQASSWSPPIAVAPAFHKCVWMEQEVDRRGRSAATGGATPSHRFPTSSFDKPHDNVNRALEISRVPLTFSAQARENLSVFSPGPAAYHAEPQPGASPARRRPEAHTMCGVGQRYHERVVHDGTGTPGPAFPAPTVTSTGQGLWAGGVRLLPLCAATKHCVRARSWPIHRGQGLACDCELCKA